MRTSSSSKKRVFGDLPEEVHLNRFVIINIFIPDPSDDLHGSFLCQTRA